MGPTLNSLSPANGLSASEQWYLTGGVDHLAGKKNKAGQRTDFFWSVGKREKKWLELIRVLRRLY
jgi:hypothetical protein